MIGRHRALTARETARIGSRQVALVAAVLSLTAIIAAALAVFLGGAASGGGQVSARAAADTVNPTCAALRAQFGPGWPCISVPNYTPTTIPTAPTAPGGPTDGSGVHMGVDAGPGPGIGNGTPIVPVPGQPAGPVVLVPTIAASVPAATPFATVPGAHAPQSAAPSVALAMPQQAAIELPGLAQASGTTGGLSPLLVDLLAVAAAGLVLGGGLALWRSRAAIAGLGTGGGVRPEASPGRVDADVIARDSPNENPQLPGSPLVDSSPGPSMGNAYSTTRVVFDQTVPPGWSDLSMTSPLAQQYGTIQLDPDSYPQLVGGYSGNLIEPNPNEGFLARNGDDAVTGLPGWTFNEGEDEREGDILDVDCHKQAHIRAISATPIMMESTDQFGHTYPTITYKYNYQVQYTYSFEGSAIVYTTKWTNLSDTGLDYLGGEEGVPVPVPR